MERLRKSTRSSAEDSIVHCSFTQPYYPPHTANCRRCEVQYQQCLICIRSVMSFADLPPELVPHVAAALRDIQDIFALMRANRGLHRWPKNQLYQYIIDNKNSTGILRIASKGNVSATYFFLDSAGIDLHALAMLQANSYFGKC